MSILLVGDVREQLRGLPDESVQTCCTSPPYWGLRSYKTEPVVWGGIGGCEHKWEMRADRRKGSTNGRPDLGSTLVSVGAPKTLAAGETNDDTGTRQYRTDRSSLCAACGAWRGSLGLEPLHDCLAWARGEPPCAVCYVCHLRTIWRELWRVLHNDGTCWLVIGDSMSSGGRHGHGTRIGYKQGTNRGTPKDQWRPPQQPGLKPKDCCCTPWRVGMALQVDGWYLRRPIIWAKGASFGPFHGNPMPESTSDRPTRAHEYVLLLAKSERYYYDREAVLEPSVTQDPRHPYTSQGAKSLDGRPVEQWHGGQPRSSLPTCYKGSAFDRGKTAEHQLGRAQEGSRQELMGRNLRDVWTIATRPYAGQLLSRAFGKEAHFATFPEALVEPCILASTSERGCCPKCGAPWRRITRCNPPDPVLRAVYSEDSSKHVAADPNSGQRRLAESTTAGRKATGEHDAPFQAPTTLGWRPSCTCNAPPGIHPEDLDVIASPLCRGQDHEDPTLEVGRAGYSRPRRDDEGQHYVTRYEQRQYAAQLKASERRAEMATEAGDAFAHYLRTDRSGGRPVPHDLLESWIERGWLTRVEMPDWIPPAPIPCTVLDPFAGSGTTLVVAQRLGRSGIGIDLNPDYIHMAANRIGPGVMVLGTDREAG